MSTGTRPGGGGGPLAGAMVADGAGVAPLGLGTRFMLQIGHWPGWSCSIWGCIGQ